MAVTFSHIKKEIPFQAIKHTIAKTILPENKSFRKLIFIPTESLSIFDKHKPIQLGPK